MSKRVFTVKVSDLRIGDYYQDMEAECFRRISNVEVNQKGHTVLSFNTGGNRILTGKNTQILDVLSIRPANYINMGSR